MQSILNGREVQSSLIIEQPDDAHEEEDNRASEQALLIPIAMRTTKSVDSDSSIHQKSAATREDGTKAVASDVGATLPIDVRSFFESRFGYNFGKVRLHTDAAAAISARAVSALAYTVGHNIIFGAGHSAPDTMSGRKLLAHELAHVVQQGQGITDPMIQR